MAGVCTYFHRKKTLPFFKQLVKSIKEAYTANWQMCLWTVKRFLRPHRITTYLKIITADLAAVICSHWCQYCKLPHFLRHPFTICMKQSFAREYSTHDPYSRQTQRISNCRYQENRNDLVGWKSMAEGQLSIAYENTSWPVAPSEHTTSVAL
jgi:hypothetical protein